MTPGLPWRVLRVVVDRLVSMDVRLAIAAVDLYQRAGVRLPVTAFCAEHGISRKTFYEIRSRYRSEGLEGLVPRSRRPRSSPSATPPAMLGLVIAKRLALIADGRDEGAQSIQWALEDEGHTPPSVRTIHRILVAHDLVVPQPQKRPRSSYKRFASPWANGCWQLDGHERLLLDGSTVVVLRVQDDCSRRILASRAAISENTHDAWECVKTAIGRHGAPAMFLTDNGSALSQRRAKKVMSEFEARLRGEGILPITSSVSRPQTCGKKEREWETLDKWLAVRPAPANLADLQHQLDGYDLMFNHERRHQALDGRTPAHVYDHTPKAVAAPHPLAAPAELRRVKVWANGAVSLGHGQTISVGREWAHSTVDVLREDPACAIFHDRQLLELFHINPAHKHQKRARR